MIAASQLGKRIAYLRKKVSFSQEDLSLESGVHKNYISELENGKRNPSLMTLAKLAKALNVTLEQLFQGIDNY